MLDYRFKILVEWPRDVKLQGQQSPYRRPNGDHMPLSDTLEMLDREIKFLSGRAVIIQLALPGGDRDIRLDGQIRANARRPSHPGVILTFDCRYGTLSYPSGQFVRWEENLRAVAYHLEHVRKSQLYGVGSRGEAYRGFAQIPAAGASKPVSMDAHDVAARQLLASGGYEVSEKNVALIRKDSDQLRKVYGQAVLKTHPDHGGRADDNILVRQAFEALKKGMAG